MTTRGDFVLYNRLKSQLETELTNTEDEQHYKKLRDLYRRNFPTKEQAIEEVQAFYKAESQHLTTRTNKP